MKTFYLTLIAVLISVTSVAQIITFPDVELKNKLLAASPVNFIAVDANGDSVAIDTNADGEIDMAEALVIFELDLASSAISDLTGLENFINLTRLEVNLNDLTAFNGTAFTNLEYLDFSNNDLTTVDVTGLVNLEIFWAFGNPFTTIDVSTLSGLQLLDISYSDNLTGLDVSNLTNLTDLSCSSNDAMSSLNVLGCTALEDLNCEFSAITGLDVNGLANLSSVFAGNNNITAVDVTGAISLSNLNVEFNQITTLNVQDLPLLQSINADANQITNFNMVNCPFFYTLLISDNQLQTLDLSQVPNATIVYAQDNLLENLILAEDNEIVNIHLSNNLLTDINLNYCMNLNWGTFNDNPNLESLYLKNGSMESLFNININNLPSLQYVCADEMQLTEVQTWLVNNGYNNVNVNSSCPVNPVGVVYEIEGMSRFDFEIDGCEVADPIVPFMNYTITDGVDTGTGIANGTGMYYIPVEEGTYTVTPSSVDPALFDVSPASFTVTFPANPSPFEQDICFVPNSMTDNLEVLLSPVTPARPGFDATYQLIVNNVGNQIITGDVELVYLENLMTFLESDVPFDASTPNSFTWNFNDLMPFQSFVVNLTFTINPPTDPNFPVNIDDVLIFTATASPLSGDANPLDNIFTLEQIVVGAFDPNDIRCLQGETLSIERVGDYVHYLIRFENTGNFPAENIVVVDEINTDFFQLESLRPVNASHDFVTQITENKVEFIFEGINLPFNDEDNDGYVLFKIKTVENLQTGDSFSNAAEIYFDFNLPIFTNTYVTTIKTPLGTEENILEDTISVYPNPSENKLFINSKNHSIQNYEIVDILGKTVLMNPAETTTLEIDVATLHPGNYFIKLVTQNGTFYKRFIKK
ncbi:MAG: internalin [Flavobacteriaceae bacterium]|nr:internalin [Flavobacteriaceae bacterium]